MNPDSNNPDTLVTEKEYFLGFEDSTSKLRELWQRWKTLENWIDLALRPKNCHPDDRFLLSATTTPADAQKNEDDVIDDISALKKQCQVVQTLFNNNLSTLPVETTIWDPSLIVKPSQIKNAGMGLYYQPTMPERYTDSRHPILPKGSLLCYYTGHVHTHSSARALEDKSYLMWIRDNTLVDPMPLLHVKARYINDPLNDKLVNCEYVPTRVLAATESIDEISNNKPHHDTIRTSVVATRDIAPGEELFVRYGDTYWNQQPIAGNRFDLAYNDSQKSTKSNSCENNDQEDNFSCDDGDDDSIEEMFPFSAQFQSKLRKTIDWGTTLD